MDDPASAHTLLLVEDNEDNRIIYATALRYAGYSVVEATTGTEGIRAAREELVYQFCSTFNPAAPSPN